MKRLSESDFIKYRPYKDDVIAIKIADGKYYFAGWMEDAENYNMQIAKHPELNLIGQGGFDNRGSLYQKIFECADYNHMYCDKCENSYKTFLEYMDQCKILLLNEKELNGIYDVLRDGLYVFIIEN